MNAVLLINEDDNVVICLKPLTAGEILDLKNMSLTVKSDVLSYHKLALFAIRKGDLCYSLGRVIGRARRNIDKGEPVHQQDLMDEYMDEYQENQPFGNKRQRKPASKIH